MSVRCFKHGQCQPPLDRRTRTHQRDYNSTNQLVRVSVRRFKHVRCQAPLDRPLLWQMTSGMSPCLNNRLKHPWMARCLYSSREGFRGRTGSIRGRLRSSSCCRSCMKILLSCTHDLGGRAGSRWSTTSLPLNQRPRGVLSLIPIRFLQADISVRSPRMISTFIIYKVLDWILSIQTMFFFFFLNQKHCGVCFAVCSQSV